MNVEQICRPKVAPAIGVPDRPALRLACAPNFRDLGGIVSADGRSVRHGRLFRSDHVRQPMGEDVANLAACAVGIVFDLRSAGEAASAPNQHWIDQGVDIRNYDIGTDVRAKGSIWERLKEDSSPEAVAALMLAVYRAIPTAILPALRDVFDTVAEDAPPLLLHCAAGKDRTGVIVALLLHALDVPRDRILEDYLETLARSTPDARRDAGRDLAALTGKPLAEPSLDLLLGVRSEFLDHCFEYIARRYGSVDQYLRQEAYLDRDKSRRIREQFLERSQP